MNFADLAPYFADEERAIELVEGLMWPNGPVCPHCGGVDKAYRIKGKTARPGLLKCGHCRKQFTVRVGTIFESSHIPLTKWLIAIYMMCSSKKGVSANQLHRALGISYKAAWFLCHRIRYAMTQPPLVGKLSGIVEADETYIGGRARGGPRGRGAHNKAIVMALLERDGQVRTFPVPNIKRETLQSVIRLNVEDTAHIMTDSLASYLASYKGLGKHFASHDAVDHSKEYVRGMEYVRGIVHTNFAESYFSLLKRGILGTFHHVSEKHLPRYLREFEYRWNSRHATDGERTSEAIKMAANKRLMYRKPLRERMPQFDD